MRQQETDTKEARKECKKKEKEGNDSEQDERKKCIDETLTEIAGKTQDNR